MSLQRATAFALLVPIVASAGCSRSASDLAGSWDTVYGGAASGDAALTLTGSGSNVNGTYSGSHTGTLTGTLHNGIVSGRWKESDAPKGQGTFTFTFSADGKSFKGLFRSDDGTFAGSWDGRRTTKN
jgi:hypothetical protein